MDEDDLTCVQDPIQVKPIFLSLKLKTPHQTEALGACQCPGGWWPPPSTCRSSPSSLLSSAYLGGFLHDKSCFCVICPCWSLWQSLWCSSYSDWQDRILFFVQWQFSAGAPLTQTPASLWLAFEDCPAHQRAFWKKCLFKTLSPIASSSSATGSQSLDGFSQQAQCPSVGRLECLQ